MSDVFATLDKWFLERPKWLQNAVNRLVKQSELSDEDISELAILCRQEVEGKLPKPTSSFVATAFSQGTESSLYRPNPMLKMVCELILL